jgi:cytochrome P450
MNSTLDMIFHSGDYQCLGEPVALMELNKILAELLKTLEFSIVDAERPASITNAGSLIILRDCSELIRQEGVWLMKDFWVRVTSRE